ncbi:unnamed protein product, partial [Ectocarpus fasciculatus]
LEPPRGRWHAWQTLFSSPCTSTNKPHSSCLHAGMRPVLRRRGAAVAATLAENCTGDHVVLRLVRVLAPAACQPARLSSPAPSSPVRLLTGEGRAIRHRRRTLPQQPWDSSEGHSDRRRALPRHPSRASSREWQHQTLAVPYPIVLPVSQSLPRFHPP